MPILNSPTSTTRAKLLPQFNKMLLFGFSAWSLEIRCNSLTIYFYRVVPWIRPVSFINKIPPRMIMLIKN